MNKIVTAINVKAQQVVNNGDGVFTILVEATELPPETLKMIRDLLPHTCDKFHDLLAIENVLASVVNDYVPKQDSTSNVVKTSKKFYPENK